MNSINKYKDIIISIILIIFSLVMFVNTKTIRVFAPNSTDYINAQFFPYILSSILFICALFQLFIAIRKLNKEESLTSITNKNGVVRVLLTLLLLGLYVFFMNTIGFLIVTLIYIFLQSLILSPKEKINIKFSLVLSVISTLSIYFLFTNILEMILPRSLYFPF